MLWMNSHVGPGTRCHTLYPVTGSGAPAVSNMLRVQNIRACVLYVLGMNDIPSIQGVSRMAIPLPVTGMRRDGNEGSLLAIVTVPVSVCNAVGTYRTPNV